MAWVQRMKMQARMLLDRGRTGDRLTVELDHHIEAQTAENIAAGMSAGDGAAAFGNPGLVREQARATWSWNWVERLGRDVRVGLRTLARARGFTLIAVLVMALGIGANVTIFAVVRAVLLNPLLFRDPSQLVAVYEHNNKNTTSYLPVAGASFLDWQRAARGVAELALVDAWGAIQRLGCGRAAAGKDRRRLVLVELLFDAGGDACAGAHLCRER